MKCKDIQEMLSAYANGQLGGTQKELIETHCTGCAECRTALAGFQTAREQLLSPVMVPEMAGIGDAVMGRIEITHAKRQPSRWLQPAFIGVPVMVVMILLAVFQPWTPTGGTTTAMAMEQLIARVEATSSMDLLKTCRVTVYDSAIIDARGNIQNTGDKYEFDIAATTIRLKLTTAQTGNDNEFLAISGISGTIYYTLTSNDKTMDYGAMMNKSGGGIPSKSKTKGLLQGMTEVQQLPDQVIDGVMCLHYKGISGGQFGTNYNVPSEFWIGKEDYIIRQITQKLPAQEGTANLFIIKYFDFNMAVDTVEPVTGSDELLAGWVKVEDTSGAFKLVLPKDYIVANDEFANPYFAKVTFPSSWLADPPMSADPNGMFRLYINYMPGFGPENNQIYDMMDNEYYNRKMTIPVPGSDVPAAIFTFSIDIGELETTAIIQFTDPGVPFPYDYNGNGEFISSTMTGQPAP